MRQLIAGISLLSLSISSFSAALIPSTAHASSFDKNFILSDDQLKDYDSMTQREIQSFLQDQGGFIASYETENHDGEVMLASEIIYNVSQEVGINPKFLIVLLQKEQSLITDDDPSDRQLDWATGYAVCDSCSKDDPAIQRWKGFGKQVNSASLQFIEGYLEDIRKYGYTASFGPGMETTLGDGTIVEPENATTAGMYAYTPHIHGNKLFHTIWNRWFGDTALDDIQKEEPRRHVSGTLLKAYDAPEVYYIDHGVKRYIASWTAFVSRFNPDLIVEVDAKVIEQFPTGREISLPNYSLLEDESGNVYMLVDDVLRPFESRAAFKKIGFVEDELVRISNDEVTEYASGEEIAADTAYPTGRIMRLESGLTFVVKDSRRHLLLDDAVMRARFPNLTPVTVTANELSRYLEGPAVLLPDGYLVKSTNDPSVYVISEGLKLPIPSEEVFYSYGFSFDDVRDVSSSLLKMHETGPSLQKLDN